MNSSTVSRTVAWVALIVMMMLPQAAKAQPVAVSDTIQVSAGALVEIAPPGIRGNDVVAATDSVVVELVHGPVHGAAGVAASGSLWYAPNVGFVGTDSLVYRLQTVPVLHLELNPAQSRVDLTADLSIPNLGTARDAAPVGVGGYLRALVWPDEAPFDSVRVVGMQISNADSARMQFHYGNLGVTVLTVELAAAPDSILLSLEREGGTARPGLGGLFVQEAAELGVQGGVHIRGSGLLGGAVPSGSLQFRTSTTVDLTGIARMTGPDVELIISLDLAQQVPIGENTVDLRILGDAVASGPVVTAKVSNLATVTFRVSSGVGVEETPEDATVTLYPNPATERVRLAGVGEGAVVEVVDVLGRVVLKPRDTQQFEVGSLARGPYFVLVRGLHGGMMAMPLMVVR